MESCDVILHGHEHESAVVTQETTFGSATIIPAGASYDRRESNSLAYANGYSFCRVNLETGEGRVYLRRFNGDSEWMAHTLDPVHDTKTVFSVKRLANRKAQECNQATAVSEVESEVTFVTSADLSSVRRMQTSRLQDRAGVVCVWVYVGAFGTGIRKLVNNRYIFAQAAKPEPPYANVFALSRGPRRFVAGDVQIPEWKVWICREPGRELILRVRDTEELLPIGWHHFAVAWDDKEIRLLIDNDVKTSSPDYRSFWPDTWAHEITVGAWPKHWREHYAETHFSKWKYLASVGDIATECKEKPADVVHSTQSSTAAASSTISSPE